MENHSVHAVVMSALRRGELHPEYLKENKLLAPDDPRTLRFESYMQGVVQRLYKGSLGPDYHIDKVPKVRFMLVASDTTNAWIDTNATPPILAYTSGLIDSFKTRSEAELAGVLCHELTHEHFADRLGPNVNGKMQELAADLRAPYMLRAARYPQSGLRSWIERMPDDDEGHDAFTRMFKTARDKHPKKLVRASALLTAERALARGSLERGWGQGEQKLNTVEDTKIPNDIMALGKITPQHDVVYNALEAKKYDRASWQKKIQILEEVYNEHIKGSDSFYEARRMEFDSAIRTFRARHHAHLGSPELGKFLDSIIFKERPDVEAERVYQAFGAYEAWQSSEPVGNQRAIGVSIATLKKAGTKEEAIKASKTLIDTYDRYNALNKDFMASLSVSGFSTDIDVGEKLLKGKSVSVPWKHVIKWAIEAENPDLIRALAFLQLDKVSGNLATLMRKHNIPSYRTSSIYLRKDFRDNDDQAYSYVFDANGNITGYTKQSDHAYLQNMRQLDRENEQADRAYTQTVDWSLLRSNPVEFYVLHKKYILGAASVSAREYPFSERFTQELDRFIEEDPDNAHKALKLLFHSYWDMVNRDVRGTQVKSWEEEGIGLPFTHPMARWILAHEEYLRDGMFHFRFTNFRYMNNDTSLPFEKRLEVRPEEVYAGLPTKNPQEYFDWLRDAKWKSPFIANNDLRFIDKMRLWEMQRMVEENDVFTIDDIFKLKSVLNSGAAAIQYIGDPTLVGMAKDVFDKKIDAWVAQHTLPDTLDELIHNYRILSAGNHGAQSKEDGRNHLNSITMMYPELAERYEAAIRSKIEALTNPHARFFALEKLILRGEYALPGMLDQFCYTGNVANPLFKEWITQNYTLSIASSLAEIPKNARYSTLKHDVRKLQENSSLATSTEVLERLLRKDAANIMIPDDHEVSFIRQCINDNGLKNANTLHMHFAGTEITLQESGEKASVRSALIPLLTEPYNEKNAANFLLAATRHSFEGMADKREQFEQLIGQRERLKIVEQVYKRFWALPFEARTLAFKSILFPLSTQNDPKIIKSGVAQAIEAALPSAAAKTDPEVSAARLIVQSYFDATTEPEDKRLMAASIMVANQPGLHKNNEITPAKGLSLVLGAIDPAGDKVKQAIESHPETPASIKEAFKESKTMAKDPPRDLIVKWVKQSNVELPEDQRIVKIQRVLGAGSYGITVEGLRKDGQLVARTLLYQHVRAKAQNEFEILNKAVGLLVSRDRRFEPVLDMVRQAQQSSIIETDMNIAAKQAEVAAQLYNGLSVVVGGETFTFEAARYMGHGADHKDFAVMPGEHFNDLTVAAKQSGDPTRVAHVKALAKALMAAEIMNLLSGDPFDHDRHGGQQRIEGNHIGQFDFGGLALEPMTMKQREILGTVFGKVINAWTPDVSIANLIHRSVTSVAKNAPEREFLAAVERGVLALGNFQSELSATDMLPILAAVIGSGKVDPTIRQALESQLDDKGKNLIQTLEMRASHCGMQIQCDRKPFPLASETKLASRSVEITQAVTAGVSTRLPAKGFWKRFLPVKREESTLEVPATTIVEGISEKRGEQQERA